jgi:hypothetical protein
MAGKKTRSEQLLQLALRPASAASSKPKPRTLDDITAAAASASPPPLQSTASHSPPLAAQWAAVSLVTPIKQREATAQSSAHHSSTKRSPSSILKQVATG